MQGSPRRGADCSTLKECHHRQAPMRTFGCLGSAFPYRTLGPFHELRFAESCSHVCAAQHDCKRHSPLYEYEIFDDGCFQDEFWDPHPSQEFRGWRPVHFVDPLHVSGHVRVASGVAVFGLARGSSEHSAFKGVDVATGSRLCQVGDAQRCTDALLRHTVFHASLPLVLAFSHEQKFRCNHRNGVFRGRATAITYASVLMENWR